MNDEQITPETKKQLDEHFDKAMQALVETQRSLNEAGIAPPALASALCASYVTFVAALIAASDLPRELVLRTAKEAIDSIGDFAIESYERMVKKIKEGEA